MKKIERDVCLGHEEVPFGGKGELGVTGGETGAEVVLPGLNCAFGSIASVDMCVVGRVGKRCCTS